jgi:hypothetical protein
VTPGLDAVEDHTPPKGEHHLFVVCVEPAFGYATPRTGAAEHVRLPGLNAVKVIEGWQIIACEQQREFVEIVGQRQQLFVRGVYQVAQDAG